MYSLQPQLRYSFILPLFVVLLTACASATPKQPTVTLIPTETNIPTITPNEIPLTATTAPTATEAPAVIPEYFADFIGRGYDKQPIAVDGMYMVLDETGYQYTNKPKGINFNGTQIFSWRPVEFINENGELVRGNIIGVACIPSPTDPSNYYRYDLASFSATGAIGYPKPAWIKGIDRQVFEMTSNDHPIIKTSGAWETIGVLDGLFAGSGSGNPPSVEIPGIGTVFLGGHYEYVDGLKQ